MIRKITKYLSSNNLANLRETSKNLSRVITRENVRRRRNIENASHVVPSTIKTPNNRLRYVRNALKGAKLTGRGYRDKMLNENYKNVNAWRKNLVRNIERRVGANKPTNTNVIFAISKDPVPVLYIVQE
jgi:hypothetical protein